MTNEWKYGNKEFVSGISDWAKRTEDALLAIGRQSVQDLIDEAQTPRDKGGNMPVLTGFLRASGRAKVNSIPSGDTRGEKGQIYGSAAKYSDEPTVSLAIADWNAGDTIYFGWTAEYALAQEYKCGFVETATQNWQQIVRKNEAELKKRYKI